uniref:Uncharacterized protein n=1 Tax=Zea mays TaxID=4577 RepID=B6SQW2_MAIZE|nr:hypothetical protein [Zea mays]
MALQSNLLSLQLITRNYASFRQRLPVFVELYDWWKRLRNRCCKESKKIFDGLLISFWWNIWLERNNRIFHRLQRSAIQVMQLVKDQIVSFSVCNW